MVVKRNELERTLEEQDEKVIQEFVERADNELKSRWVAGGREVYIDAPTGARNYMKVLERIKQIYGRAGWTVRPESSCRNESYLAFGAKQ
jgi:hypothetical protein